MREARKAFRRFWPLTRGDRRWMLVIVGCVMVSALAEATSILLFAELTDDALEAGSLAAFWGPAGAWLAVAAVGALVGYLGNSLATWTAERFVLRLRANVFRHVQGLPPHFFQKHRQGDLVERLTGDVEAIEQLVLSGVVGTVSALFSAAAALYLRWDLALATFVLAPLFLLAARQIVQPLRRLMSGRTTIMITHDLTLAPDADRILVLDEGRLVEWGAHPELIARQGAYARLANPWPRGDAAEDAMVLRV
ncbi:ABC transporter transmembrane domain-containing protein [Streptomyces sp. NPDC002328]|uniref:ABC transporter transmembrane domain-containing protein n=1 Tax=Streptomyces sp. NPDC002328 TaxID=3364642 RepID=UPI00368407E1